MHDISTLNLSIIIGFSFLFGMITQRILPSGKIITKKLINWIKKD